MPALDLIVFSHLRWNFVYQRPQHLLSRMARSRRILFLEEPVHEPASVPRWDLSSPADNLTVCRPVTPLTSPGFADDQLLILQALWPGLMTQLGFVDFAAWVYTPLVLPLVKTASPRVIAYDCMDELSAFLNAPEQLLEREQQLFECADLVFTGGPSLQAAKQWRHPRVYCFPSSVDTSHFCRACAHAPDRIPESPEMQSLARPRLGYFGAIDERLDLALLAALADQHPDWQVVMVGPVVKLDPAQLPRRPNIHYFGQRPYAELPAFLAGWDVCLLPFALNDATRFISPTKTLEYMAAERPIVSTPIADVAGPYGHIVRLGDTPAAFIAACEQALASSSDDRARRVAGMREVLRLTSWDETATQMASLLDGALPPRKSASQPLCATESRAGTKPHRPR